jgi:hypothetical protein
MGLDRWISNWVWRVCPSAPFGRRKGGRRAEDSAPYQHFCTIIAISGTCTTLVRPKLSGCTGQLSGWLTRLNGWTGQLHVWMTRLRACVGQLSGWLAHVSGWMPRFSACMGKLPVCAAQLRACLPRLSGWTPRLPGWPGLPVKRGARARRTAKPVWW